ncbi:MAG: hypothetical protein L3J47_12155 [Sulfurovum sp.]|nr:hypothetical protein [Sulfurovum sp.]
MGLKLEFLLVLLIALTSVLTMTTKLADHEYVPQNIKKELEFTNTTFTEVTTEGREGVAFGTHGTRSNGVLEVEGLRYHSDTVKRLLADKGRYKGDNIYLDGNVRFYQESGFEYHTEHGYYHKPTAILYATSPFVAMMDKNILHGERMAYHTRTKEVYAESVDAVLYTAEK